MSDRSNTISKLISDIDARTSYIRAKLGTLVPAQIRALRLKSEMPRQLDLAKEAQLHQSRISMFETPGMANMTLETLSRLAAAFQVGLVVKFVPFSDMLKWENGFSQDAFDVTKIAKDTAFIDPVAALAVTNTVVHARAAIGRNISNAVTSAKAGDVPAGISSANVAASTEQGQTISGTATVQINAPFRMVGEVVAQRLIAI